MQGHSLTIAFHKSEMVISTRKRIDRIMHMRVGDVEITSISAIRYLGVVIDTKLSFWQHIFKRAGKGIEMTTNLSLVMASSAGSLSSK